MVDRTSSGWYRIQQVSEFTGLSAQLIRKWEQRYKIVQPRRLSNGYRVYSDQDVRILQQVTEMVQSGHSVRNAVLAVSNMAVAPVAATVSMERDLEPTNANESVVDEGKLQEALSMVEQLLDAGDQCDKSAISLILQRAYHGYGFHFMTNDVIVPFLTEVGHRWASGVWGEYQEHVVSLAVRDHLVRLRASVAEDGNGPLMLGACVPGERHEITMHLLLLHAAIHGWRALFLGSAPAESALMGSIEQLKPRLVVLSSKTTAPFEEDPDLFRRLDHLASQHMHTTFWIGGHGTDMMVQLNERIGRKTEWLEYVPSLDEAFSRLQSMESLRLHHQH